MLGRCGTLAAFVLGLGLPAGSATVIEGDPGGPLSGINYTWQIVLEGGEDGALVEGFVGGRSWAHPMNPGLGSFGLDAGWTHTSNWIHLSLAEERGVEIRLAPSDAVPDGGGGFLSGELVPAFSLFAGVDEEGLDDHWYVQGAVPHFVDAPGFAFLTHADQGPGPFVGSAAEVVLTLPAGLYSIVVGGHDSTPPTEQMVGYALTVPEPDAALQLVLGAALLVALRRGRRCSR